MKIHLLCGFVCFAFFACSNSESIEKSNRLQNDFYSLFGIDPLRSEIESVEFHLKGKEFIFKPGQEKDLEYLRAFLNADMVTGSNPAIKSVVDNLQSVGFIILKTRDGTIEYELSEARGKRGLYSIYVPEVGGFGGTVLYFLDNEGREF